MSKSRPVVIIFSILAGLQILSNAGGLSDIVGAKIFFLFGLMVAAVQVGMTFYVQNTVVPQEDVGSYVNQEGKLVAGPASGVTNGKEVEVIKTEPPASEGQVLAQSSPPIMAEYDPLMKDPGDTL